MNQIVESSENSTKNILVLDATAPYLFGIKQTELIVYYLKSLSYVILITLILPGSLVIGCLP